MRHKYYEERRKERIRKIHEFINDNGKGYSGLQQMKEHFPFFLQEGSGHVRNAKSATNFNAGSRLPNSQERSGRFAAEPDIPLRVQLDPTNAVKQRLVNKEFEKMCLEKIQEHKKLQEEEKAKKIADIIAKEEQV